MAAYGSKMTILLTQYYFQQNGSQSKSFYFQVFYGMNFHLGNIFMDPSFPLIDANTSSVDGWGMSGNGRW